MKIQLLYPCFCSETRNH